MLCWQQEQWAKCPGCGLPRDEAWGDTPEEHAKAVERYYAEPLECAACAARDRRQRRHNSTDNAVQDGIYFVIRDRRG